MALAFFITGSQSGDVVWATKTSPTLNLSASAIERKMVTFPAPIFSPTAFPVSNTFPFSLSLYISN